MLTTVVFDNRVINPSFDASNFDTFGCTASFTIFDRYPVLPALPASISVTNIYASLQLTRYDAIDLNLHDIYLTSMIAGEAILQPCLWSHCSYKVFE